MNEMEYLPLKNETASWYDTLALAVPFVVALAIISLAYFTGVWSF